MIKIRNLTKRYGDKTVYENFDLEIEEGKTLCILGDSGSGKTTLLNCLANLTGYTGEVPDLRAAYVFQTPRLVPCLTVKKNLALVCKDGEKIAEILKEVNMSGKADKYPVTLSGGEAQRVSLARAFLADGDIMLLDEPFSSLDLKIKTQILELFLRLQKEKNKTAVFVTHDIGEAVRAADRAVVLKEGKIFLDISLSADGDRENYSKLIAGALMS